MESKDANNFISVNTSRTKLCSERNNVSADTVVCHRRVWSAVRKAIKVLAHSPFRRKTATD